MTAGERSGSASEAGAAGVARRLPARDRLVRPVIAAALVVAGLCYSSWVLEFVLPIDLNPLTSFLSELDAEGRPYRWVFDLGDTVTGSLVVLCAVAALFVLPRRGLSTIGWVALGCFGASTIADARAPLHTCSAPCPPSDSGLFPQLHQIHALTSTLAVTSIFVAMIAFTAAAFRYRQWPILRRYGLMLMIVAGVATVWMLVADNLSGQFALGVAQRIQIAAMSLWLIVLALHLLVAARDQRRRTRS